MGVHCTTISLNMSPLVVSGSGPSDGEGLALYT